MIRHFSSGGIVYQNNGGQIRFLLRQSHPSAPIYSAQWGLPKGWLDDAAEGVPGPLTLGQKRATPAQIEETALREVREEGGVEAKIICRLGNIQFFFITPEKEKVLKTVIYFLMEYVRDLPEGFGSETSAILWVDPDTACSMLDKHKGECELIRKAVSLIT